MINAIANYALNEIERASQDEFERHIFLKSYAVAYTSANFLQLVIAAILAWVLPGKLSFLSLLVLVPLLVGSTVASAWLRNHVARPQARRSWTAMIVYFIPMIVMLAGIAYNAYPPADGSRATYLIGALVGSGTALILTPFLLRRQNRRDQARLDAKLED
ncbi:transcriptional regulator [Corynebacterium singulare]|nr:transcriptional regulator [Corynebacterium singulare]